MPEIVECKFNLFEEGRKYTGHHRKYILENAQSVCLSEPVMEKIRLREAYGYFGHGRRQIARKMNLGEVEAIKLPNGQEILVENIPSNITTHLEVRGDGTVYHKQEILESEPGKIVSALHKSRVGGFSWACSGNDGGAMGATRIDGYHGMDYVLSPGFAHNRGYILESADDATRDFILESVCKMGVEEKRAEKLINHWVASAQLRVSELEEKLSGAEIYEDSLREEIDGKTSENETLRKKILDMKLAETNRRQAIMEAAKQSTIVVPEHVLEAIIEPANEQDFSKIVRFFESAKQVRIDSLPLRENMGRKLTPPSKHFVGGMDYMEYGDPGLAPTFDD